MKTTYFLACAFLALVCTEAGKQCTDTSECEEGECCQIPNEYLVVSRKRADKGTCERYTLEDGSCGIYDKINGFCSCAPGLKCTGFEIPIIKKSVGVAKKSLLPAKPGYTWLFKCAKPTETSQLQPSF
ncbi:unnamed protein product [Candidula unifasciata]|uniref:Uncharacterized protein n=1 Tax=Candidula unifasciata TaxID=100452 RepID=A0A8S3YKV9_9EUPU|nr:unnamed protein product [Candidula unifasciata]